MGKRFLQFLAVFFFGCLAPLQAQQSVPKPFSTLKDCDKCPELVVLPPGKFLMGASAEDRKLVDAHTFASEQPQHQVTIGYSFAIGRFEVTVEEFAAYVAETGAKTGGECMIRTPDLGPNAGKYTGTPKAGTQVLPGLVYISDGSFTNPGAAVTPRHPATCISRREAKAYLAWLSKKTGRSYRFPTEAEWEYAVRAGSTTPFHFGGGLKELCRFGNFADRNAPYHAKLLAQCAENPSLEGLVAAGSFQPNAWGLHDMIGNAFEFIEDCAMPNYAGAPADGSPWWPAGGSNACRNFATRGYFFDSPGQLLRSAARCHASTWDERSNALTIRVAVSLDANAWDGKR